MSLFELVINLRSPAPCAFSTKCSLTPERGKKVKTTHQTRKAEEEKEVGEGDVLETLSAWLVRGMKEKKRPSGKSGTRTSGHPGTSGKSRRVGHREVVGRAGGSAPGCGRQHRRRRKGSRSW